MEIIEILLSFLTSTLDKEDMHILSQEVSNQVLWNFNNIPYEGWSRLINSQFWGYNHANLYDWLNVRYILRLNKYIYIYFFLAGVKMQWSKYFVIIFIPSFWPDEYQSYICNFSSSPQKINLPFLRPFPPSHSSVQGTWPPSPASYALRGQGKLRATFSSSSLSEAFVSEEHCLGGYSEELPVESEWRKCM